MSFAGFHVAAFESRRLDDMARLIERHGGVAHVAPSMREVPLKDNHGAIDFANRLMTAQIDAVILLTGVGTRHLVAAVERHVDRERFLDALQDTTTIARGPKPVAALKEFDITPTHRVPEPNTWRELLQTIDEQMAISGQVVGLQEYGQPNPSLVAGLEARGATVVRVKVYDWALPEDTSTLERTIRKICDGEIEVAIFTSANQVANLLAVADSLKLTDRLCQAFNNLVVASIGPTTSDRLRQEELPVDLEPVHAKMGQLVAVTAERSAAILQRKRKLTEVLSARPIRDTVVDREQSWYDSLLMKACRREPTERTPVWLMRQAGRYMREYRKIREQVSFLELCKDPSLCAEVAITAADRLGVDAAIIFSDLLPILEPMGLELEYSKEGGPVIHNPVRDAPDVERILELESVDSLHYVMETCRITRAEMPAALPLLGFAGAPFTLASYVIEGGGSRNYLHTKTLMYRDPGAWDELMSRLVRGITKYLNAQISAGVQAVQIFDSWVGCLSPEDYRQFVLPHSQTLIAGITADVPVIHFGTGNPALLPLLAEAGGQVVGVDWRVQLDDAWELVGHDRAVQGNLDPLMLLAEMGDIRAAAADILDQAAGRPGHIFNLGHGIIPQTPVDNAIALVDAVKELSAN
ncbi:MAG: uroporphyrinogen decarboxylase [Planctomycetota bacterium]|nr:uroporphyrinogen decarboxylase [Planctomycetota bacterium]